MNNLSSLHAQLLEHSENSELQNYLHRLAESEYKLEEQLTIKKNENKLLFQKMEAKAQEKSQPSEKKTSFTPKDILQIAQLYGPAELVFSPSNLPIVVGEINDIGYQILFTVEDENTVLSSFVLHSVWTNVDTSLDSINDYNSNYISGKVFLDDDNDLVFTMFVLLQGVRKKYIKDKFKWFGFLLEDIQEKILD